MTRDAAYLLVWAAKRQVGLPVAQVVEVVEPGPTYAVPSVEPALRGVTTIRGRILPVVHLGALLDGGPCPAAPAGTGIIWAFDGGRLCLEVEAAETVLRDPGLPVPPDGTLPWAVALVRHRGELVPLLDLSGLANTLFARVPHAGTPAARALEVHPV